MATIMSFRADFAERGNHDTTLSDEQSYHTAECLQVAGSTAQPVSLDRPFYNAESIILQLPNVVTSTQHPVPQGFVLSNGMSGPMLVERQLAQGKLQEVVSKKIDERINLKIMPLELAMKREMAYRAKIERLRLQCCSDSRETSIPSQQQQQRQKQKQQQQQQRQKQQQHQQQQQQKQKQQQQQQPTPPTRMPLRTPYIAGTKREVPSSDLQFLPPQQSPSYSRRHIFCKVCKVTCSSAFNLKQHYAGNKHKNTLKDLEENKRNSGENCGPSENKVLWCKVCWIACMNEYSLKQHLVGKKHFARLGEIEDAKRAREEEEAEALRVKRKGLWPETVA